MTLLQIFALFSHKFEKRYPIILGNLLKVLTEEGIFFRITKKKLGQKFLLADIETVPDIHFSYNLFVNFRMNYFSYDLFVNFRMTYLWEIGIKNFYYISRLLRSI